VWNQQFNASADELANAWPYIVSENARLKQKPLLASDRRGGFDAARYLRVLPRFGEKGYFHSGGLHVTERLWRDGENLVWQATVDDPNVLATPWTMPARVVKPSSDPLEESPKCVEDDGKRLLNNDHHDQR
jgi:hypothetical protein